MLKRLLIISIALISAVTFSSLAWSDVTGTWDVVGTVKVAGSPPEPYLDEFTFGAEGVFQMIDMDGDWAQDGKSFVIDLDPLAVEAYYEAMLLAETQVVVDVTVTSLTFKGKESKDGTTIKGKFKMKMDYSAAGVEGKLTAKAGFTGARSVGQPTALQSTSQKKTISEVIAEKVREAILAGGSR